MATTEQQALDREFVEDFARNYEDAWHARDADRIAAACTEDVEWNDPALREPLHGRDGVRRFVRETVRMAPDFRVDTLSAPCIVPGEPTILVPYRMTGTATGPWEFLDMAPTGRSFEIEGVDRWEMRDGLIARYTTFYDGLDMSRQLGVVPEHGSAGDRVITRLQHVQARFQRRSGG